ncbi:hypothetical protein [Anatilimnocola floriformis]|uniref:hypothetical protein n=1 Tax=Anatilimnocola floriformis TaxID=2948575 RepID=UPI0020C24234|nr:hypothetical protein [Anatilimnocola floriformis]
MRFGLVALNAVITLFAVLFWLWTQYGVLGFVFFVPLALLVVGCMLLSRWNRRPWAYALFAAYFTLWVLTATWGGRATTNFVRGRLDKPGVAYLAADPRGGDHFAAAARTIPDPPWVYIGWASAPCPFVTSLDYACEIDGYGRGDRAYFIWAPGMGQRAYTQNFWWSGL